MTTTTTFQGATASSRARSRRATLDDAIRAAARRAVHTRPAPLVVPTGRQRWYFPLAAAAIIVLAVAVTMHVEREQPGEEIVSAGPPAQASARRAELRALPHDRVRDTRRHAKRPAAGTAKAGALRDGCTAGSAKPLAAGATADPGARGRGVAAGRAQSCGGRTRSARAAGSVSAYALQSPEQWLQGIADLRRQGRHEEADKALAEFRKRYPDYRISKEMLEQLEKR